MPAIFPVSLQPSGPHRQEPLAAVAGDNKRGPFPVVIFIEFCRLLRPGASVSRIVLSNFLSLPPARFAQL